MADSLNQHYATVSTDVNYERPPPKDTVTERPSWRHYVTDYEAFKMLDSLRPTATGLDNLSVCDICDNVVSTGYHLQCNTCEGVFHPLCANINNDGFRVLQPILPSISWVCPACISSIRNKHKTVDDQLQSLSTALHKLEEEHRTLVQKVE